MCKLNVVDLKKKCNIIRSNHSRKSSIPGGSFDFQSVPSPVKQSQPSVRFTYIFRFLTVVVTGYIILWSVQLALFDKGPYNNDDDIRRTTIKYVRSYNTRVQPSKNYFRFYGPRRYENISTRRLLAFEKRIGLRAEDKKMVPVMIILFSRGPGHYITLSVIMMAIKIYIKP